MSLICMLFASVIFAGFAFLFMTADDNLAEALITVNIESLSETIKLTQTRMNVLVEEMKASGMMDDKRKINEGKKLKKKLDASRKLLEKWEKRKISVIDLIPMAGYRLIQLLKWDATNETVKKLNNKCVQFKEKREAVNYTYYLLASLMGNIAIGFALLFLVAGIGLAMGLGSKGIIAAAAAFAVFALMGYLPYDSVNATITKRTEEIEQSFPQVVSKMTLLTVAGMEVNQAWKLASVSGKGTLYDEMTKVLVELDNNVSPTTAYSGFITRCNNKYTTKLATAIIQNMSKGNSEIVKLFSDLNTESWLEHKHNSRRMGEKIQSKLMVPTMLMFGGIIILVIVPVIGGFNF